MIIPFVGTFYLGSHLSTMMNTAAQANTESTLLNPTQFSLQELQEAAVPEPSTFVLATMGLAGLGFIALRKKYRRA